MAPLRKLEYFHMTDRQTMEVESIIWRLYKTTRTKRKGWQKALLKDTQNLERVVMACIHDEPEPNPFDGMSDGDIIAGMVGQRGPRSK